MTEEKRDQSILDEYGNRIPAQRRLVPAEILGEKDTQPEASRREVSNSDNQISNALYKNISQYPLPLEPTTTTTYSSKEKKKERKKERIDFEKYRAYFEFPVEMQVKWVSASLRVIPEIYEAWSTVARRVEVTRYKNGKLQQALTKSMLLYLAENEAEVLNSLDLTEKLLDTTKLHSPEGSTTKLQPVSSGKSGKKVSNRSRVFYPAACPTTNRKQDPKECRKCSSSWPRAGCIYPEKADRKEKAYLRNHPMEAILRLR